MSTIQKPPTAAQVLEAVTTTAALADAQLPIQPNEIPYREIYSVKEAQVLLGVSKDYLYTRINNGEIPIVNLGTDKYLNRRIARSDLIAFIDSRRVPHTNTTGAY